MSFLKKIAIGTAVTIISMAFVIGPSTVWGKDTTYVDVLTCPFGTSVHTVALAAGDIAKKNHEWLRITAAETPGYIYNLEALEDNKSLWKNTIVCTAPECVRRASKAEDPFDVQVMGIKYLMTFYPTNFFLVTLDPEIKNVEDLAGKRVALGYKSQIDWGMIATDLLDAAGILDSVKVSYMGTSPASEALLDGKVDACGISMIGHKDVGEWQPQPQTTTLIGTGKELHYISWGKELIEKAANEKGLAITPNLMPKGTIKWQDEDIVGFSDPSIYGARDVFPEELAYEFVKLHLEHYKKVEKYHKTGKVYAPETFIRGLTKENTHPGAIKAFEEAGIEIPNE